LLIETCLTRRSRRQRQWRARGETRGRKRRRISKSGEGWEEEMGSQEEDEGSSRRRRTSVRGSAVVGEREEGGTVTLAHCNLIMSEMTVRISKIPYSS